MPQERNALKLGMFTIIVMVLFFSVLLWISKRVGGNMSEVEIRLAATPAMPSIATDSAIFVGGQKIGKVLDAELILEQDGTETGKNNDPLNTPPYVWVKAEIREDVGKKLRANCMAHVEAPPLGGDGVIKLDIGNHENPFEGSFIPAKVIGLAAITSEFDGNNPQSLLGQIKQQLNPDDQKSLMAKLHASLLHVNNMTEALSNEMLLDPKEKKTLLSKIHAIAESIQDTTANLEKEFNAGNQDVLLRKIHLAMDALHDGLVAANELIQTSGDPVKNTLVNLERTTEHLANETDASRADSLIAHFKQAGEQINDSLANLTEMTSTARDVLVLNRENINRMLINFKESSDHIKSGVKYVLRHPWRLLNAPTETEMKQQALFDAARSFSEAATRLDDASAQLRALTELHKGSVPVDDPELARIRADLTRTHQKYRQAEEELWRQLQGN